MIIAVDGTAASGKGTLAKRLATTLGLAHLDTGALYRGVGYALMIEGFSAQEITPYHAENAAKNLDFSLLDKPELRTPEAGEMASIVAAIPEVRQALLDAQRQFAQSPPEGFDGAVLDGRDIGTVVLPDADVKFFVDADLAIRADRRTKELINQGHAVMLPEIQTALAARDKRDMSRKQAPLKPAEDAIMIDTSDLDVEMMVKTALSHCPQ